MKLVLKGTKRYIERMFKHLLKEHPSTKKKMYKNSLIDAEGRLHCIICGEEHPESKRSYKKSKLKKVM